MQLILIPGFWLDGSSWSPIIPALEAAGHHVHALTLPGMGRDEPDRARVTLRDQVDAVVGKLDSLDPADGAIVLVGHSGGGAVAHAAVDARPLSVSRVVYVDSGPLGDGGSINDELPVVDGLIPLPDWSVFEPEDLIDLDEGQREAFRASAIPTPARVARDAQKLSDERRYNVPITVICCEFSAAQLREWLDAGAPFVDELARIQDKVLMDLPTGHWPQLTRPDDLARLLAAVLAQPGSSGDKAQ